MGSNNMINMHHYAISINVTNSINGWLSAGRGMDDCGGRMCQNQQT